MRKKDREEEFIVYSRYGKEQNIDKDILYNRIDKKQKLIAKLFSISIFIYFVALAWLCSSESYF